MAVYLFYFFSFVAQRQQVTVTLQPISRSWDAFLLRLVAPCPFHYARSFVSQFGELRGGGQSEPEHKEMNVIDKRKINGQPASQPATDIDFGILVQMNG